MCSETCFLSLWECEQAVCQACGTVTRSHRAPWMCKQTCEHCAQMGTKGRLMGEARRSQVDQGEMWERWNLPPILLGPPPGREMSDLQDSAFSWETWRFWCTHTHTHTHLLGKMERLIEGKYSHILPFLRKQAAGFHTHTHTQTYSNLYRYTSPQRSGWNSWHAVGMWYANTQ